MELYNGSIFYINKNNFLKKNILDLDSYNFSDLISTFTFNFIDEQIKFIFDLKEKSKV